MELEIELGQDRAYSVGGSLPHDLHIGVTESGWLGCWLVVFVEDAVSERHPARGSVRYCWTKHRGGRPAGERLIELGLTGSREPRPLES